MLHLHFAPAADLLVPELLVRLRAVWTDPFCPPTVIVPSPAVGKWLRMRLVDCTTAGADGKPLGLGCAANIGMLTLERFFWHALQPAKNMQRLDAATVGQIVCSLLTPELLAQAAYAPVAGYVLKADGSVDQIKKVQLASRIARQFQEYEFNRPSVWDAEHREWRRKGLDAHWLAHHRYDGIHRAEGADDHELWQMDLYCRVHTMLSNAPDNGASEAKRWISFAHLHRLRRERGLEDGTQWQVSAGAIFLFQVSKVSHFHRNTLVEISQMPGVSMQVFLTNPCAEFWEDIDTLRSRTRVRRTWNHNSGPAEAGVPCRDPSDYHQSEVTEFQHFKRPEYRIAADPPLLQLWGRAGKENIYLWCPMAQWQFDYYSPAYIEKDAAPQTLLAALQTSLLRRETALPGNPWTADGSLQVLATPDPGREIEEVREQILDLVHDGAIDKLTDVVVYLPDPGLYLAHIHRVFGAFKKNDAAFIPYAVLGAPGSDSLFSQGVQTLCELIEGRFDRSHVFSLLRNPIVQATRTMTADEVGIWEAWAEELGIFRGYNREHRSQMGDLGETITDSHTFELGMARLLLGNLAAGPVELKYQVLTESPIASVPAFSDFETSDAACVEKFCNQIEKLYADTVRVTVAITGRPVSLAVAALDEIITDWFGTIPTDANPVMAIEGRMLGEFRTALESLRRQEDLAGRTEPLGVQEFLALVRECLPAELPAGSKAWTGGITFAPLRPAMIVPHKVVFALGLDATAFPGTSDKTGWNLLSHRRIVGDSDTVIDNRFAFLELLHAARKRLVLSFRGRNMQKEEELQPSSVILEIESFLKSQGLISGAGERCLIRREIPWIIRESLTAIAASGRRHGTWDAVERNLSLIARQSGPIKKTNRYAPITPTPAAATQAQVYRTSIVHLRKFFANPLEYHLAKTLGIEPDEQPATMSASDEPLESGALERSGLQKTVWTQLLGLLFPADARQACTDVSALQAAAAAIAHTAHQEYLVQGGSPEAQFCIMERQWLLKWAAEVASTTISLLQPFNDHVLKENVALALSREGVSGELAVDLGADGTCFIECRHQLALLPRSGRGAIGIVNFKKEGKAAENPDLWLAGVVQWWMEQSLPQSERVAIHLIQLNREDGTNNCAVIKPAGDVQITQWLPDRIREMLCTRCADHLPFSVIQKLFKGGWDNVTRERIEEILTDDEHGYKSFLEALMLVDAHTPDLPDSELQKLAQARFQLMLEGLIHA
jgi:exonuclease V gamma subunit